MAEEEELVDYEEEELATKQEAKGSKDAKDANGAGGDANGAGGDAGKKGYVTIHSTGFKDFLLKPELLRAIVDCGFEHPSEGEGERARTDPGGAMIARHPNSHAHAHTLSLSLPLLRMACDSPTRVHPAGDPRYGRALPSQVRHGQDGGVRFGRAPAARAQGGRGRRDHHVPHA